MSPQFQCSQQVNTCKTLQKLGQHTLIHPYDVFYMFVCVCVCLQQTQYSTPGRGRSQEKHLLRFVRHVGMNRAIC